MQLQIYSTQKIRLRNASNLESIHLLDPRTEDLKKIRESLFFGFNIINKIPKLRAEYLLKGTSGLSRRDWGVALANFWIVIEQLISTLWEKEVIIPASKKERKKQLSDTRTWNASNRIELLYQIGFICETTLSELYIARKARNSLSHEGKAPTERDALSAYNSIQSLFEKILIDIKPKIFDIDLSNHTISDPFKERTEPLEPQFFMEIPKLPNELELEIKEASLRSKIKT